MPSPSGTVVYAFCADTAIDPVASHVFAACLLLAPVTPTALTLDRWPVFVLDAGDGRRFVFARTARVLTDAVGDYLPWFERHWPDVRLAAVINWHEGAHAPDRIFTVHTNGDPDSGTFCPADPLMMRAFVRALERHRVRLGLDEWQVLLEATHWSGGLIAQSPAVLASARLPVLDIEIGSQPDSWRNPAAAAVVAHALVHVFEDWQPRVESLLGIGGVHCEPIFRDVMIGAADRPYVLTHLISNRSLNSGDYGGSSGLSKLRACVRTIRGGIHGILCHQSVKASHRSAARQLADELEIPLWRHHTFRAQHLESPSESALPSSDV